MYTQAFQRTRVDDEFFILYFFLIEANAHRLLDIETFYEFLTLNWHIHGLVVKWKFVLNKQTAERKKSVILNE